MARPPIKPVDEKLRIVLAVLRGEVSVKEAARRERVSHERRQRSAHGAGRCSAHWACWRFRLVGERFRS
jgi:hypothetical protein